MPPQPQPRGRLAMAGSAALVIPALMLPVPGAHLPVMAQTTVLPVTVTQVVVGVQLHNASKYATVVVTGPDGSRLGSANAAVDGRALVPVTVPAASTTRLRVSAEGVADVTTVVAHTSTTSVHASPWMMVNKQIGIGRYRPGKLVHGDTATLDPRAARAWALMKKAAAVDGVALWAASSYRSYRTQVRLFGAYAAADGAADAATFSAHPGHSEHQTGLALDVASQRCTLRVCFATTRAGRWVAAHAERYGFIVRYPKGQEKATGYIYEPWHLRYVGAFLAGYLRSAHVNTLEQAFGLLPRTTAVSRSGAHQTRRDPASAARRGALAEGLTGFPAGWAEAPGPSAAGDPRTS